MGPPSGIPVPAFAFETPQRQSRLTKMRQSLGGQGFGVFTQPDKSLNMQTPQVAPTQSAMRPTQSIRRQSTRPGAPPNMLSSTQTPAMGSRTINRQAIFQPPTTAPRGTLPRMQYVADDRALRENASFMLRGINEFLRKQGKDLTLRTQPTPSAKEFQDAFLFIYNLVFEDDRAPTGKKMDEEVIELLRQARYPWMESLSKLSFSIIQPHIWPHLIGALSWMVGLYNFENGWMQDSKNHYLLDEDPGERMDDPGLESNELNHPRLMRLFLCYLSDVWPSYLAGKDNFDEQKKEFAAIVDGIIGEHQILLEEQEQTLAELVREADGLRRTEDAEKQLKAEMADIDMRIDHAQEVVRAGQTKLQQQIDLNRGLDLDLRRTEEKLENLIRSNTRLADDVRRQNLSAEEVARMYRDREELGKQLEDLMQKDIELQKTGDTLAVSIYRKSDEIDTMVENYANILYEVGLHPKPPPLFHPGELDFNFNRATNNLDELITGADISASGELIRKLQRYTATVRNEKAELATQAVMLENELEVAQGELDHLSAEVIDLRKEVNDMLDTHAVTKATWEDESRLSRTHLETMRREIAKIKSTNQDRGLELSMKLQTLELAKTETATKIQRLKTRLIKDLVSKAEEIAELKTWTTERLESLTRLAKEDDIEVLSQPPTDLDTLIQRLSIN